MVRESVNDLRAFMAVADEMSFTRAAAKLGVSQSALSHTIRGLEARIGVRLLTRTTRSVAPTEPGERLLQTIRPAFGQIDGGVEALIEARTTPAGTFRINATQQSIETVLWPALKRFLPQYPDIKVEITADSALTDIVAGRFDAGVRLGEQVAADMIAVKISGDMRMIVVGAPSYFETHPRPLTPRDLTQHNCINLRLLTHGNLYAWEFGRNGQDLRVRVDGQLTFNAVAPMVDAAVDGFGLACVIEDSVIGLIDQGRLIRVLEDWCPTFPGYHLYYPSRRQSSQAFTLLVDALRYRA
jgi:DNA-binding transcriptional LysR family regulator